MPAPAVPPSSAAPKPTADIPLGIKRPAMRDPGLEALSETDFDARFRQATKRVDALEEQYDAGTVDRAELAAAQDELTAAELERYRRNFRDVAPEDVFTELLDKAEQAARFGPQSQSFQEAGILLAELERQGATQEQILSGIRLRSPDAAEIFASDLADLGKLVAQTGTMVPAAAKEAQAVDSLRNATAATSSARNLPSSGRALNFSAPTAGSSRPTPRRWSESPIHDEIIAAGLYDAAEPAGFTPVDQAVAFGDRTRRPLDPFQTDQGVMETVEAGGETAIDQMLRDRRQNKFREKAAAIRARRDAWINQTLEQAGERGSLEYVSTERPDRTLIVSPVPGQPGRWRTTTFDERGPIGHYEFDSREQAIRAVGGEHHTKQIAGPSYFGTGEYVLKRSKERYNIAADGRPLDPFRTDQGVGETVPPDAEWNVVGMGRKVEQQKATKGTKAVAQRMVNAEEGFLDFAMRTAGITREQAVTALEEYRKAKAIKIDPVGGQFSFTHGGFAEADVLRRAAGVAPNSETAPAKQAAGAAKAQLVPEPLVNPFDTGETSRRLAELQSVRPRPANKMFGASGGTTEQRAAYDARVRQWNSDHRKAQKAHREMVEKSNEWIRSQKSLTKPADVRPAEPGEQPAPPAQAAPAMQGGMDNLRFTSEPVERKRAGKGRPLVPDAKDAKAKLIAELEKAVEAAPTMQDTDSPSQKVTIEIPGDGTFTVWNTKEQLGELLKKARRLETGSSVPSKAPVARAAKMDVERVIEDARKVYGDRRSIDILRRQAADESLEIEPRDRALLNEAAERLFNSLPEKRLKSELDILDRQIEAMSGRRTEFSKTEFDRRLRQFKLERTALAKKLEAALAESGQAPSLTDAAIAKLEALKVDTSGKVFDAIQGIPVMVWNGALSAAQVALRAGARVAAAIDAAVQHIRRRHRGAFDEQAVRAELERDLLTEARFETGSPLPDFQPYATAQRMFTRAFGAETLPWVGRLFGPRGKRVLTVVDRALVTWAAEAKGIGKAVASAIGTELAGRVDAVWRANAQGDLNVTPRTPGKSLKVSDVLEALQQDPDAYVLTPEQRRVWDRVLQPLLRRRRELVARHGLAQTEDADGNLLAYFPRIVTRNPHTPDDAPNSGGARVGGRQGFQKPRAFRTERQGWEAGYEYETSIERRLVTSIERLYHAMADQRLANNPDLQGRTRAEVVAELTEYHAEELGAGLMTEAEIQRAADGIMNAGRVNQPAFAGRTFARPNPNGGPGLDLTIKTQLDRAFPQAESNARQLIMQGNNLVKTVRLGFDVGAPFVQGLPLFFRNPATWGQAYWSALRALFSPHAFARMMLRPENQRAVRELAQLGSPVGQLPEMLSGLNRGEILDRIPAALGRVPVLRYARPIADAGNRVKTAFGRHFSTFMDSAKVELWKAHRDLYPESQWPELAQSLESLLLSGRMEAVGVGRNQASLERVLLLAPSYYRGAVNLVSAIGRPGVSGHVARRALLHFAAGSTAAFVGVGLAVGMGEDELKRRFNPNHPNFMQWTVTLDNGRQMNFGFGGILRSWIRLLGSMVQTSLETPKDWLALDSTRNPIARWLRGHLAPLPGFAMDLTGRDFMGRQTDLSDLPEQLVPLWAAQMVDKTGRLPPTWRELTTSWTGLSGYSQTAGQYIRRRAAEFDRSKDGPQPKRVPEDSPYARLEWALRLDNPKAAREEYNRLIERLPPAPNKTPQRMVLEHFHRLASDNAFSRYRAREAEFRKSLTPEEQELYRIAQEEQRALYGRLKSAITPKP